jgi:hypothetical protein
VISRETSVIALFTSDTTVLYCVSSYFSFDGDNDIIISGDIKIATIPRNIRHLFISTFRFNTDSKYASVQYFSSFFVKFSELEDTGFFDFSGTFLSVFCKLVGAGSDFISADFFAVEPSELGFFDFVATSLVVFAEDFFEAEFLEEELFAGEFFEAPDLVADLLAFVAVTNGDSKDGKSSSVCSESFLDPDLAPEDLAFFAINL